MAQDAELTDNDIDKLIEDITPQDKPKRKYTKSANYMSEAKLAACKSSMDKINANVKGLTPEDKCKALLAGDTTWIKRAPVKAEFLKTYPTLEALTNSIELYIVSYDGSTAERTPTLTGLALWLGFTDRQDMYNKCLSKDSWLPPGYVTPIRKAAAYLESLHEANLSKSGNHSGSIFWLKNRGWSDIPARQESKGNTINIVISNKDTDKGLKAALSAITTEAEVIDTQPIEPTQEDKEDGV